MAPRSEPIDPIVSNVRERCAQHLSPGTDVAVGLSGGLDSVVLLGLLHDLAPDLGIRLRALHVHHGLSPQADAWAMFCARICAELGVPLAVERVCVADDLGLGLEAAARAARYDCYETSGADVVALAHHADDQAETVLLQLLRGAGPAGLAGMPEIRRTKSGLRFLRPLLGVSRIELRVFAESNGLQWVDDASNADIGHARNFIRHDIVPRLATRFPAWRRTLGRVAANAADAMALADVLGTADLQQLQGTDGLELAALEALGTVRAANVLRVWLRAAGLEALPRERLLEILRQCTGAGRHRRIALAGTVCALTIKEGRLTLERRAPEASDWTVQWGGEAFIRLPDGRAMTFVAAEGAGLRIEAIQGRQVCVAMRRGGERLRLAANRPRRTLKDLLRESGLPPWERDRVPLVLVDGQLAWACGVGADAAFAAGAGEPGVVPGTVAADRRT